MFKDAIDRLSNPALDALIEHPLFRETAVAGFLDEQPLTFIDIGARGGTHHLVRPAAGRVAVLAFEPDPEGYEALLAEAAAGTPWARFRVEPVALAGHEGRMPLHLLAVPTNHSLLPPNEDFTRRYAMERFAKVGEIEVSATTLDQVVFGSDDATLPWGEFIKLDTQLDFAQSGWRDVSAWECSGGEACRIEQAVGERSGDFYHVPALA